MTVAAEIPDRAHTKSTLLQHIAEDFQARGYQFHPNPDAALLPTFLDGYRPDAIAVKGDDRLIVEIKQPGSGISDKSIAELRRKMLGHTDWRLNVVYSSVDPGEVALAMAPLDALTSALDEVERLRQSHHNRAALMLAWATLEATANFLSPGESLSRARSAAQVVQSLGMNGWVTNEMETRLRSEVPLRNRVVHGDLTAAVPDTSVQIVVAAVTEALATGSRSMPAK